MVDTDGCVLQGVLQNAGCYELTLASLLQGGQTTDHAGYGECLEEPGCKLVVRRRDGFARAAEPEKKHKTMKHQHLKIYNFLLVHTKRV